MASLKNIVTSLVLAHLSLASPGKYPPAYHHGSGSGNDTLGAVASESSICSKIGTDILKEGGNAADSLIATTLCVGVIGMVRKK
jgi:gamma-glutamyltranspeptidase/glutathione hydrolase